MKLIGEYIQKHLGIFLLSTLFLTMEAAADLLQPTFMSFIVDRGIRNADTGQILLYGVMMLGIAMGGASVPLCAAVLQAAFPKRWERNCAVTCTIRCSSFPWKI